MGIYLDFVSTTLTPEAIEAIGSKNNVGELNFKPFADELLKIKEILLRADGGAAFLTDQEARDVHSVISSLPELLRKISALTVSLNDPNSPTNFYNAYLNELMGFSRLLLVSLTRAVAFANPSDTNLILEYRDKMKEITEESLSILNLQKVGIGKDALTQASQYYDGLYKKYRAYSICYGLSVAAALALFSLFAILTTNKFASIASKENPYVNSLPLVTLFALAWFALRILSRNLRFSQNQMALNKAKSVILQSGEKYAASAVLPIVQSQITWAVVSNVFSLNDLGSGNEEKETLLNLQGFPSSISKLFGGE